MAHAADAYYVPHGSRWPIVGSVGLTLLMVGFAKLLNGATGFGGVLMTLGVAVVLTMMVGWFGTVIRESERGAYNDQVDRSFRLGMLWFIVSEIFFFAAFFGALFYARQLAVPWLGGEGTGAATNQFLWPGFDAAWPTNGPVGIGGEFETIPAFGVPLWNTAILLTSGVTITLAHHALRHGRRTQLNLWLGATVALGALFLYFQASEYLEAYQHLNLTLASGIYGSTFFMLTGFHGMHVTVGAIMLCVILARCVAGHFTPTHHFGFEAVAWYWHFVDVVWLGLFVFVYVL